VDRFKNSSASVRVAHVKDDLYICTVFIRFLNYDVLES
jgi:hypothetical protein